VVVVVAGARVVVVVAGARVVVVVAGARVVVVVAGARVVVVVAGALGCLAFSLEVVALDCLILTVVVFVVWCQDGPMEVLAPEVPPATEDLTTARESLLIAEDLTAARELLLIAKDLTVAPELLLTANELTSAASATATTIPPAKARRRRTGEAL
jgi:hypothetical protein